MAATVCSSFATVGIQSNGCYHLSSSKPFAANCSFNSPLNSFSSFATVGIQSNGCYHLSSSKPFAANCSFNSPLNSFRLRIFHKNGIVPSHVIKAPTTCCLGSNFSTTSFDSGHCDATDNSTTEATFDLKLPRRSLLVHFTCDSCGERTKRLINRLAYERGTVFVQCAGCLKHHKLIDNLGLVVEYDFRENSGIDSNEDQH